MPSTEYAHQFLAQVLIDSGSSVAAEITCFPFYSIWLRQQTEINGKSPAFSKAFFALKQERAFYKGFGISMLGTIPCNLLYLQGQTYALRLFGDNHLGQAMQGPCAQACAKIVSVPVARLITLKQAGNAHQSSTFNRLSTVGKVKSIIRENGIRGLYRGFYPSFVNCAMTDALGFWLQAQILNCYPEKERKMAYAQFPTAFLAFLTAFTVTLPIDTVLARMNMHETHPSAFPDKKFLPAAKTLYRSQGWRGFFKGGGASVTYSMLEYSFIPFATVMREKMGCD